ncbi:Protein delta 1 [Liparis tanakae]|uniref:Protein delta 1 n=1 Tax=Liparis tanakae TaxID=230148 RepID=A0A4Z2F7L3_9TELE|nr:Protein delta 1 [Liparis tanakae]
MTDRCTFSLVRGRSVLHRDGARCCSPVQTSGSSSKPERLSSAGRVTVDYKRRKVKSFQHDRSQSDAELLRHIGANPDGRERTVSSAWSSPAAGTARNGGTCREADGSAGPSSCSCPPGSSGDFCEAVDRCRPNPCLNGGNCTALGAAFTCACPLGFSGSTCGAAAPSPCAGRPCADRGACVGRPDGSFRCACHKRFTGPTCALRKVGARPADRRVFALTPQHYALPAHSFHQLLRPPDRDLLKVTLRDAARPPGVLAAHGQLVCFGVLALLTCSVILGTTGIVFFGRCAAWRANAKYSQLLRQQRERLLGGAGAAGREEEAGPEEAGRSVNLILPEKIRLASFGRHYTSI